MNEEYPRVKSGIDAVPSSTNEEMGADAVSATVSGGGEEWGQLQGVVEAARADFVVDSESTDAAGLESVTELPEGTIGKLIEGWPEEAKKIFIDRLAVRLLRYQLQGKDVPLKYGVMKKAGVDLPYITIASQELSAPQIEEQKKALLASDPGWERAEPHAIRDKAAANAASHEREEIIRLGTDIDSFERFEGVLVGAEVLKNASVELSEKLMDGIEEWARNGSKPFVEEDDNSIEATIQRAILDAIRYACHPSDVLEGDQLRRDGANRTMTALRFGNILSGDKRSPGYQETYPSYPNLFGYLSIDNVVAYMDKYWDERQQRALDTKEAEREIKKGLLSDLRDFVSVNTGSAHTP